MSAGDQASTSDRTAKPLTVADLVLILQAVDPAVVLVAPRVLRRVIKIVARVPGLGLQVPHRKSWVCSAKDLAQVLERDEWEGASSATPPDTLILLQRPRPERVARQTRHAVLLQYWRLLFHAHVHRELIRRAAAGELTETALRERIKDIGRGSFDEIRTVLEQEKYLLPSSDDGAVFREFAAVYLELRYLAPAQLPWYFPSLRSHESIDALLAPDVDAKAILARTRPCGAPEPPRFEHAVEPLPDAVAGIGMASRERQRTEEPERPPILSPTPSPSPRSDSSSEQLVRRLSSALHLGVTEAEAWLLSLSLLQGKAAGGGWTQERRLLYDLERVCIDAEREVYALDLIEWAASLGKRPIRRLLPGQGLVLALKHLRRAFKRLPAVTLLPAERFAMAGLMEAAFEGAEHRLRDRFRPLIEQTLDQVGLCPRDFPERAARHKLIEELLDRIAERGFLNLGDLRDALSRNQLKLPDLGEQWRDPLIEADQRFAESLDGVYRRGEIYLRGLQRLSCMAFGTSPGRLLTRFVALPFGGAFFILEGLQHLVDPVAKLFAKPPAAVEVHALAGVDDADPFGEWTPEPSPEAPIHLLNVYSFLGLSLFLLALLHVPAFRAGVARWLSSGVRAFGWFCVDVPNAVLQQPLVRLVLESRPFTLLKQFLLKPLLWSIPVASLFLLLAGKRLGSLSTLAWFLAMTLLLNSRFGRDLEETATDWLVRAWKQIHSDFLPGIFWWVTGIFKRCVETSERLLYAVDEWLRFRAGDGRWALFVKPALGVFWFFATYLIRIFINLFVEPTINPIKHFPVVTVAAKLIVPIIPQLGRFLSDQFAPLTGRGAAGVIAGLAIFFLPGLAGFLVWEFKENWKLYRANRSPTLRPIVIGHHGETMLRLLRPGFHSGTIPKQFAKLRKSLRRAQRSGNWSSYRKQRRQLHELEHALRQFLEREFLFFVNESKSWTAPRVSLGPIELATNRIAVELACSALSAEPARLLFLLRDGVLEVTREDLGWLRLLSEEQRRLVGVALAGVYRLSGVDSVNDADGTSHQLDAVDILWSLWVKTWEREEAGKGLPNAFP